MNLLAKIFGNLSGGFAEKIGTIIDNVHTSGEEKGKLELAKMQLQIAAGEFQAKLVADVEKMYLDEMANLRDQIKVELQSEDPYVRRARPTFMYIVYLVMFINLIVIPVIQMITGKPFAIVPLPEEMWYVFGGSYLGYAYLRTVEKRGGKPPFSK